MSDNDAESDTESYFLTPVNEYNIVDKIQSANNLLFASIDEDESENVMEIQEQQIIETANKSDKFLLQTKHRVTFSSDIEEYEDDGSEVESANDIQYKDDEAIDKEIAEIIERGERATSEQLINTDNGQIDGLLKRLSMEEIVSYSNDEDSVSDDNEYTTELEVVEEITEVIVGDDKQDSERTTSPVPIEIISVNNTNAQANIQMDEHRKRAPMLSKTNGNDPPCRACNKLISSSARTVNISNYIGSKNATGKRPATSQTKRIASANVCRNLTNKDTINQDDLLKIHLNVRSCCENKYLDNNRLPRYNGYISQYGLSKDQLEERELNRQKYLEKRARREREIMRAKQQIAHLNELAFQQWLIRKNRVSRSKYKNMYDSIEPKPKIKYHSSAKFSKSSGNSS